jgi:hypothetical protein
MQIGQCFAFLAQMQNAQVRKVGLVKRTLNMNPSCSLCRRAMSVVKDTLAVLRAFSESFLQTVP